MSSVAEVEATHYDGVAAEALAARLGTPRLALYATLGSTMDVAHRLAADGAPAGTLVLADEQTLGRGRAGRAWRSNVGQGTWLTLVTRPSDRDALRVLSLRVGVYAAEALSGLASSQIMVKWPNDLQIGARKLGGILVEARWRDDRPEWVAIGVGVNVRSDDETIASLDRASSRLAALYALLPAIRAAAARAGAMDAEEMARYARRDAVAGRRAVAPVSGIVLGIDAGGRLHVRSDDGHTVALDQATVEYEATPV